MGLWAWECTPLLSKLPLKGTTRIEVAEEICIKKMREEFPIDFHRVEKETQNDELMSKLFRTIMFGFPEQLLDDSLKNFYKHQDKLSVHGGCISFTDRIMIPKSLRVEVLELLHSCHAGISRMKNTARAYIYWMGLDEDVENFVKSCDACAAAVRKPKYTFNNWKTATFPFERVHLDFFHFENESFLILVNSFSKWIEITKMKETKAEKVIEALERIFSYVLWQC